MKMHGRPGTRRLDAMIAETLVDAYGEDEAAWIEAYRRWARAR